jgi:signal transduction histidine kinase
VLLQGAMITWLLIEHHRRQRAEIEARHRLLEVFHLNRSAELGALSSAFAHEVSQPLGAISLNADSAESLLEDNPPAIDKLKQVVTDIRSDSERASKTIQHLRQLLRRKRDFEPQAFDFNEAAADALRIIQAEAKRRDIALKQVEIAEPLMVRADPVHIQQLILNLAMNGMEAMSETPTDGRILSIRTDLVDNSSIEVSIADSGTGIPEEKLNDIFQTFYTTKSHGTGLGLSISRTIAETYGGKIWARNKPDGGAVVGFTLPLCQPVHS